MPGFAAQDELHVSVYGVDERWLSARDGLAVPVADDVRSESESVELEAVRELKKVGGNSISIGERDLEDLPEGHLARSLGGHVPGGRGGGWSPGLRVITVTDLGMVIRPGQPERLSTTNITTGEPVGGVELDEARWRRPGAHDQRRERHRRTHAAPG
jgi:hypothetical protein